MAKKAKVVKEKSIEDRIWDSANKLRGNLTASEYQNVVLGGRHQGETGRDRI